MKTVLSKKSVILFAALILSSGCLSAQDGSDLISAIMNQDLGKVKELVENGADVNAKAENGNTPLSLAEKENDQEMVALLKKLGAK